MTERAGMIDYKLAHSGLGHQADFEGRPYVTTDIGERGVVVYGPYVELEIGRWEVDFSIALADNDQPVGDPISAQIEVVANGGRTLLLERRIIHSELSTNFRTFTLPFEVKAVRSLEFRVQTNAQNRLIISQEVQVRRLSGDKVSPAQRGSQKRAWEFEREYLDGYLRNISGVIHVGANYGQERRYYWLLGMDVIWVEPIREVYDALADNIAMYPRQRAINALLSDVGGQELIFGIASNNGASSSLLPLEGHAEVYPDVSYIERRPIISKTLAEMVSENEINLSDYQALTIDTEGAEMLVLKGAGDLLSHFEYIKCEASDFQSRTGNPSVAEIDAHLQQFGFQQIGRRDFGMGPGYVGTNWDVVWKKVQPGVPLNEPGITLPVIFDPTEVHGIEKIG